MNSFVLSAITLCLAAQCALAQYQSHNTGYLQQQRKMAPSPQTYGQQGYQANQYASQANEYETSSNHYEQPSAYRAPSSAAVSSYDERTPAASYSKPAAPAYAKQQSAYAAPQAYAKAAPKYEEPSYPPMPFAWGYDINDGYGGAQFHKENGDEYGKRTGSYGYTDAYGVYRQVDYVADEHGFRATIKTNEPGTANESPADVELHAYEPPSNYYAGQANKAAYAPAAPAAYAAPAAPASYSAPRASSYQPSGYGASASRSGYKAAGQGAYGHAQRAYEPAQQYSSSQLVPVYQKAKVAQAPAKQY